MNLHDCMRQELDTVFLNPDEFARDVNFNGTIITAIVDESEEQTGSRPARDFVSPSALGLLQYERTVLCRADALPKRPLPGERVVVDGTAWLVGDGVKESEGLLRIPMNRAYA